MTKIKLIWKCEEGKKCILFFIFTLITLNFFAQPSLYLTPKIGGTMSFTSVDGYKPLNTTFIPPYSVGRNYNFWKAPTLSRGLAVGIQTNNKRHRVEFEYEKSAISYSTEVVVKDYRYAEDSWFLINPKINERIHRFLVNYSYCLSNETDRTSMWINASAGFTTSSMFKVSIGREFSTVYLAPSTKVNYIFFQSVQSSNVNLNFRLGFDVDFYSRKKYILSLSLQYLQGIGKIQNNAIHINYTKYDNIFNNSENINHVTEIFSRGSAFQFSVSRRFQLYPWIKSKRKELQEQGVCKSKD